MAEIVIIREPQNLQKLAKTCTVKHPGHGSANENTPPAPPETLSYIGKYWEKMRQNETISLGKVGKTWTNMDKPGRFGRYKKDANNKTLH